MSTWKDLTQMTGGAWMRVERVRLPEEGISIEGQFELPALAQLPFDDQVFISAFIKAHGSIKEMERLFGVSYPTVKNRLNRIGEALGPDVVVEHGPGTGRGDVLARLERGEITAGEALEALKP